MSRADISQAMEVHLKNLPNRPATAWENVNFNPTTGVGYISAFMLFAEPNDVGYKDSPYIQRGYMQVGVHWPTNTGAGAAQEQAEAIAAWFKRGTSLANDGITVIIDKTPEITGGSIEDGRYVVRVRVRFFCRVQPA